MFDFRKNIEALLAEKDARIAELKESSAHILAIKDERISQLEKSIAQLLEERTRTRAGYSSDNHTPQWLRAEIASLDPKTRDIIDWEKLGIDPST